MRQVLLTTVVLLSGFMKNSNAQTTNASQEVKYRRSSLHTMVIESEKFPQKDLVLQAFYNAPFPDKYNDHTIGVKSFNPANYTLTAEEKANIYKPSQTGKFLASAANIKIDSVSKELPYRIQKYLDKEKIANKLVAKWFNRKPDGSFDTKLVDERGVVSTTFIEQKKAKSASDGMALSNAIGRELIPNTFVVINKFNFYANEPVAATIRDAAKIEIAKNMAGKPQMLIDKAIKGADDVYEKTKEGYSIFATSYLYKLVWNDSISYIFDTKMYMEEKKLDPNKKENFEKSNLFKLEFVGDENASALITFSLTEKRTLDQVITLSTQRIIDNVYAKLQKKYDVFKTKTPLYTGYPNPITAKIGKKEGLEGGEKFEVLEQQSGENTGVVSYKRVGTIKVDKNLIWDNRIGQDVLPKSVTNSDSQDLTPVIDCTTFKGGKKFSTGLLIRQIK